MAESKIIVYGTTWCWDCRRARQLMDKHRVTYTFINIDQDKLGEQFVLKTNKGMRSVPTILFDDGTILVEPSNNILADKLGIPA